MFAAVPIALTHGGQSGSISQQQSPHSTNAANDGCHTTRQKWLAHARMYRHYRHPRAPVNLAARSSTKRPGSPFKKWNDRLERFPDLPLIYAGCITIWDPEAAKSADPPREIISFFGARIGPSSIVPTDRSKFWALATRPAGRTPSPRRAVTHAPC
jgi:hypothetical protein